MKPLWTILDVDEDELLDEAEIRPSRRPRTLLLKRARSRVAEPALWLFFVGGLTFTIGLLILVGMLGEMVLEADMPPGYRRYRDWPEDYFVCCWPIATLVSGAITLTGAWRMRQLRGWRHAVVASILAMLPPTGCCALGLPVGIWTLWVLSRWEIAYAFKRVATGT